MKYVTGTRSVDPQTTVVTCQGEMDSLAVEELHQAVDPLLADAVAHLVFDLAAVEYVSSSILSFLMASQAKAQEKAGKISLVGASELVRQVFAMAALDSLFAFYGTLEEAGIVSPAAPAEKGRGKGERKERKAATKEDGASAAISEKLAGQRQEEKPPVREKVTPISERRAREERSVEKLQPLAEPKSLRDHAVWIGIGVLVVASVGISFYLYMAKP